MKDKKLATFNKRLDELVATDGCVRKVKNDGHMLYINGEYYVRQSVEDNRFYVCDVDGIAKGEDLEHIGDDYATLYEAQIMVDFWASGGHWTNRPDRK